MKRISKLLTFIIIINLLAPMTAMAADKPDMEGVTKGAYLLDDNEDNGSPYPFVKWGGTNTTFSTNRVSDEDAGAESGDIRLGMVRELAGKDRNYVRNYLMDEEGISSGTAAKVDYSKYKYFSFWYRGDGTANTLTMVFKYNSQTNVAKVDQKIPGDRQWRFVSYPIADILVGSRDMSELELFNISVASQNGKIYLDDLLLSELNPLDPSGGGEVKPTDPPATTAPPEESDEPGDIPGKPTTGGPDMDGVKNDGFLLDDNEDGGSNFVAWKGGAVFKTDRIKDVANGLVRKLQSGSQTYLANRLSDSSGESSAERTFDYSKYKYFSFWYRGDGTANTLTLAFKSAGNRTAASAVFNIPAGDSDWHYFSKSISEIAGNGDMSQLEGFNVSLASGSKGAVYIDDLLLSVLNPLDPSGGGEIKPTDPPSDPSLEKYGKVVILEDTEEDSHRNVNWEKLDDAQTSLVSVSELDPVPGTEAAKMLKSNVLKFSAGTNKNYITASTVKSTVKTALKDGITDGTYKYISFWYRTGAQVATGDTVKIGFRYNTTGGNHANITGAVFEQELSADTQWRLASFPISGWDTSKNIDRISLAFGSGKNCDVYLDMIALSEKDPTKGSGIEPTPPPSEKPGEPSLEKYGKVVILEDTEEDSHRNVNWEKLDDAQTSLVSVSELDSVPGTEAAKMLKSNVLKFSAGTNKNYITASTVKSTVKTALKDGITDGTYKYISFWYRTGAQVATGDTVKIGFRYNTTGGNHANITGAVFEQELAADTQWRLASFPISGWDTSKNVDRISLAFGSGKNCDVYLDMIALSEKDPTKDGGTEPTPPPSEKPSDEIYGKRAVFEDTEKDGSRHVSWDTLEDAKMTVVAVGELNPAPSIEAAGALSGNVLQFSVGEKKNYISSSRIVDFNKDGFKAALQNSLKAGEYKYMSFWYRTGEDVPRGSVVKIGFRNNTTGNNHGSIAGATFEQPLISDNQWRLASFPISGWDSSVSVDRISISIDPAPGKVCNVYLDMIALSEKDPKKGGEPEPTESAKPTPPPMAEDELCPNGGVELEESLANTYYQYRTEGSNVASAPKFFKWMEAGKDGAPEIRKNGTGNHFLKVQRRADDGSATNNNQSVWYKYQNKGIPVKPGHTYRISNYVYVVGSSAVAVKHVLKFTNCPPGVTTDPIIMDNITVQQGVWQKMVTDYYIPISDQDDPSAEYTLMFAPYVTDCDQAGTRNVVFYLDDFSAMEIKPEFTLSGPASLEEGQTAKYTCGRITNQWGDRMDSAQTVIRYDVVGAEGILPQGVSIDQKGALTLPEKTTDFRALVRASLVDIMFAEQPVLGADLKSGPVIACQTIEVHVTGSIASGSNLLTQEPADYSGVVEMESKEREVPTAFEGGKMYYVDMAAAYTKGVTVTEGVPYRVNAYVYVPGTGSAQMKFAIEGAGNITTQAVNFEKGKWSLLTGTFALPVSQSGTETQRVVTISPILTQTGAYYFDNLTMFRILPEIGLPDTEIIESPGCAFGAAVQDQWGYPFEDAETKYQILIAQGSGQGISMNPSTGEIVISAGAPSCVFEVFAGITYDSGTDLSDPDAKNIIAKKSRVFRFFRQDAVDDLVDKIRLSASTGELTKILLEDQSEGSANAEVLGLDMEAYLPLTQRGKGQTMAMLFENRASVSGKISFSALFDQCVKEQQVIDALNKATAQEIGEIIWNNAALLGAELNENPYYTDKKYTAANHAALAKDITALNRAAEFPVVFYQTVLYSTFNAIEPNDKEAMDRFLTDHRQELGVSSKYFDNPQKQVTFLAALCDTAVDSYSQLGSAINQVINNTPIDDDNSGGNHSGRPGSGGGSSGGGSTGGNKSVFEPEDGTPHTPPNPLTELYFDDLTDDLSWARGSINRLADKQIVNGVGERVFEPNRSITREEFLKIAMLAFGIAANEKASGFTDLDPEEWYFGYVASAEKLGLIQGKGDGTFGLGETITRQDMAVMAYRIAQYAAMTIYGSDTLPFTDSDEIAAYAAESVSALNEGGIMNGMGDGRFAPLAEATRAMACKVIDQLMQKEV